MDAEKPGHSWPGCKAPFELKITAFNFFLLTNSQAESHHTAMLVRKAFRYRLHLTKKLAKALEKYLNECRWLYNQLLEGARKTRFGAKIR